MHACRPRELYERTGIQLLPINTVFELSALVAEDDPALAEAETLLLIPDLVHSLALRKPIDRADERDDDAVLRPARRTAGRATCSSGSRSRPTSSPRSFRRARCSARSRRASRGRSDGATVVAVATHDTGSAVAAVPFGHHDSVFISAGTWSLVGMEVDRPLITDATFAANLTNEGGVAGTFRLLRNVTGLWLLHECRRAWADAGHDHSFEELVELATAAPAAPLVRRPRRRDLRDAGRHAVPDRRLLRAHRPAAAGGSGRDGPVHPREHRAEARADRRPAPRGHRRDPVELHVVGGGARNELLCRWTAAGDRTAGAGRAGGGDAGRQPARPGDGAGRARRRSRRHARSSAASFVPTAYEPTPVAEWDEARQRFADLVQRKPVEVTS